MRFARAMLNAVVAVLLCAVTAEPQDSPRPARKSVAIKNAKVYTVSGAVIEGATVIIEGSRIKAVAKDAPVPADATVIDASGKVVIPALIDVGSSLFIPATDSSSAGGAEYDAVDGLDTYDDRDKELVQAGVTMVLVRPLGRGPFGGLEAALRLGAGREPQRLIARRQVALKMTLGFSGGDTGSATQRLQDYKSAQQSFEGAQQYKETWEKYRKDLAEYEKKKKEWDEDQKKKQAEKDKADKEKTEKEKAAEKKEEPPKTDPPKSEPPKQDPPKEQGKAEPAKTEAPKPADAPKDEPKKPQRPRLDPRNEVLVRALDGKLPVHIEAHAADSIRHALALATEFKLKIALEGATEAHAVAEEIAKAKVPVLLGPLFRYGIPKVDYLNHSPGTAAVLAAAGVDFAIGSFASGSAGHPAPGADRFLLDAAALAAGHGLAADRALRAVTLDAAKILGLDRQLGSVDAGKAADLVILTADPFDPDARVDRTIVGGEVVYQRKLE